jgi:lycopene cyclase-like protein
MGGARPNPKQRTLGFGAAAGLVHPATGYQLTYTLSLAPSVAQALRVGLEEKFPEEAIRLAWQQIWPKEKRRCWDMYQFGMDVLCSLSASETQEFFRSFFSVPSEQWKGFLSAQVSPYDLSKTMAQVFVEASSPIRKNLVQRAMNRDGLDLLRSVLGFSY